ncbi:hypothetical protein M770_18785 [Pseudomonas aeruginosa VRFPA03]|nr:hypothetical protein M770_18785 [Pseudomonas aeruginosa VRFPA03]
MPRHVRLRQEIRARARAIRRQRAKASLANQLRQALAQGDGERLAGLTRLLFEGNLGAQGDTV